MIIFRSQIFHIKLGLCQVYFRSVAYAGGEGGGLPPPEIGKIVLEIWCYLPEVYTFVVESEIQEIFCKKL